MSQIASFAGFEGNCPVVEFATPWLDREGRERNRLTVRQLTGDGDSNTKLRKNAKRNFATVGLSLAPHKLAGVGNLCPHASEGCVRACLNGTGLASVFTSIQRARIAKSVVFYNCRRWFCDRLSRELWLAVRRARRDGLDLACRLNVFSDVPWELVLPDLFDEFGQVEFYDYTKNPQRVGRVKPNYWLTYSRSEVNEARALSILESKQGNVATVFASDALPTEWLGHRVISGMKHDLRFLDRRSGYVVGLLLRSANNRQRDEAIHSGFAVTL